MRRKINSLSAAAMGKTGWRVNPDPSIPVVPTHHIRHNLSIMSCRVSSRATALPTCLSTRFLVIASCDQL